jgi:membrane fusion protein (multidrug efflux system)
LKTIAIILGFAACNEAHSTTVEPAPPVVVGVAAATRRDVPLYLDEIGSLDSYSNVDIRARVRGYLIAQDFKDGARVAKGASLFRIEPDQYAANGESAAAALSRARVAVDKSQLDVDRGRALRQAGVISQQDLDHDEAALRDAQGQVRAGQAEAALASLDLRYTTIHSPIEGVVGVPRVRTGNLVGQDGPTLLTTVSQLDPMRVDFTVPEAEYLRHPEWFADVDQRDLSWAQAQFASHSATIELDLADDSVYPYRAVIVTLDRTVDNATGTAHVQALVPNPHGTLRPGQFARVRLPRTSEGQGLVVVPETALVSVQGKFSVAVVGADHVVKIVPVELGPSIDGGAVIRRGLEGREQVVVEGLQRVRDGVVVTPHPAQKN